MAVNIDEIIDVWQSCFKSNPNWESLINNTEPKVGGCGLIYEISNPIDRPDESIAIADMSNIAVAEPHFHINGEIEIYMILQGSGTVYVGDEVHPVGKGSVVVILPHTAHYTFPDGELVLAAINTPPFRTENYITIDDTNAEVKFDRDMFLKRCQDAGV